MIKLHTLGSTRAEKSQRRVRGIAAAAATLAAILLPSNAPATDGPPKLGTDTYGYLLPLPPIPYLDSMRWTIWKPSTPPFRTLLLPDDAVQPGLFRIPSDRHPNLPGLS